MACALADALPVGCYRLGKAMMKDRPSHVPPLSTGVALSLVIIEARSRPMKIGASPPPSNALGNSASPLQTIGGLFALPRSICWTSARPQRKKEKREREEEKKRKTKKEEEKKRKKKKKEKVPTAFHAQVHPGKIPTA